MAGGLELDDLMGLFQPRPFYDSMNNNLNCFYRTVTPNHFIFGSHHTFILHVTGEAHLQVFQTAKLRSDEEVYKSHYKCVANYNIWQSSFKKRI